MSVTQSQLRTSAERVRQARCRLCRRRPGKPCTRRGDHLGRWVGALAEGSISRADLEAAFDALTIISWRCVVPETGRAA
jgi:hypothetical protein